MLKNGKDFEKNALDPNRIGDDYNAGLTTCGWGKNFSINVPGLYRLRNLHLDQVDSLEQGRDCWRGGPSRKRNLDYVRRPEDRS